jgi:tripeptidyl-peptidase-1
MVAVLGVRGVTVFESSGDTGIGSNCLSNDGKKQKEFNPQFPGTCPYITAVGGTEAVGPEIAWRDSSGGFSTYFPRPWYQTDAVNTVSGLCRDPKSMPRVVCYILWNLTNNNSTLPNIFQQPL